MKNIKWRYDKASNIYKECLEKGYTPIVKRAYEYCIVIYCRETKRVWRICGDTETLTEEEWIKKGGKPLDD